MVNVEIWLENAVQFMTTNPVKRDIRKKQSDFELLVFLQRSKEKMAGEFTEHYQTGGRSRKYGNLLETLGDQFRIPNWSWGLSNTFASFNKVW